MSQVSIIDIEGNNPQIPTEFVTNDGSAIPIANVLEILGTTVANHGIPLETTGSGNTVTVVAQYASTTISTNATKAGFASFNSTNFTCDANGFVSLNGSGAAETITGNTGGALSPTVGNWNILGSGSLTTSGSGSTLTASLTGLTNHAVLVGAGTATITKVGPSSTSGQVLASNGSSADPSFQSISSLGGITTITGNTGGAESPSSGNFNILGTGSITVAGSANTETVQLTGLTNHAVLVGAGTATITSVGPSSTSGQVLQSAGASADPAYSTATYPATTTINQLLYSSSASTVTGLATANSGILATNGSGVPAITTASGNWNNTSRSAFLVSVSSQKNNVTGDGTVYTLPFNSSKFDQGSNFNTSTFVFTAPVTGRYQFNVSVDFNGVTSSHTSAELRLLTTARSYYLNSEPSQIGIVGGEVTLYLTHLCDMTANDTASVTFTVFSGTKVINVIGSGTSIFTGFSGYLVC